MWAICGIEASCLCTGSFVKGVFEKVGIEPQVRRLGKYKSAGDQLSRKDMSEPQREQLTVLLDDIFSTFKESVAASVGKTPDQVSVQLPQTRLVYFSGTMLRPEGRCSTLLQVQDMLDAGFVDVTEYAEQGWLTGLKYEDEIITDLEKRTDSKPGKLKSVRASPFVADLPASIVPATLRALQTTGHIMAVVNVAEDCIAHIQVTMKKYHKVSPTTFTRPPIRKRIAVIRASGTITGTEAGGPASAGITAQQVSPASRTSLPGLPSTWQIISSSEPRTGKKHAAGA